MKATERLKELNLKIPPVAKPIAAYVPSVRTGSLVYTSGQLPFLDGKLVSPGKVGAEVSVHEAYEAAKISALNGLGAILLEIQDLDRIRRVVRLGVFVNSAPGFNQQPQVANGASELMLKLFGDAGAHARTAVGVAELPMNSSVELDLVVEIEG
jgi:enamine deaminase RidA (YjgF/YER057c/UK114 family)